MTPTSVCLPVRLPSALIQLHANFGNSHWMQPSHLETLTPRKKLCLKYISERSNSTLRFELATKNSNYDTQSCLCTLQWGKTQSIFNSYTACSLHAFVSRETRKPPPRKRTHAYRRTLFRLRRINSSNESSIRSYHELNTLTFQRHQLQTCIHGLRPSKDGGGG